jgi:hypothetical protein
VKRDWILAWEKVEKEGKCRVCPAKTALDPAHVIPRSLGGSPRGYIGRDEVVPLCRTHHELYDHHKLDLLPYLTKGECATAVLHVGLLNALRQITGTCWGPA